MVKRLDPATLATPDGDEKAINRFIESDFKVRSGACPNNCGLLNDTEFGQQCPKCNYFTNVRAEREGAN